MADAVEQFRLELEAAGLVPGEIVIDRLTRCPVQEGRAGGRDGAYRFFSDPPQSGWWQNWKAGTEGTWSAGGNGHQPSEAERLVWEQARQRRDSEQARAYAEAAERARKMLAEAAPCEAHPYLERKGVNPCPGLKVDQKGRLLIPVLGLDGAVQSFQTIGPDGSKLFLAGGKMAGGFFSAKGDDGPLLVAEGLATGLSLHEATGHTILVSFNAGNLLAVATMARERYPEREIILCGDDDHHRENNPGATKARAAALAVGGKLALPVFRGDRTGKSDYNDLARAEGLEVVKAQVEAAQEPEKSAPQPAPSLSGPPPDWPFKVEESGVWFRAEDSEGNPDWQWLCSPLEVLSRTRDAEGEDWGRLLRVKDADGLWHTWAMAMSLTAGQGDEYRARLKSLGLDLAPGRKGKERLELYLTTARPQARARCLNRVGWSGHAFILPDATYGNTAGELVVFQAQAVRGHAFRVSGSLEDWQEHLARLCIGNSRLAFAVSCSFAAPLLRVAGMEGGGFHLRGGSSIGKSTALYAAGSAWGGGGVSGYCRNWRATANGLESVALCHCDALLCLDEMGQVDALDAGSCAYMLSNGQGKLRGRRDGSGRPPAQWRTLFLSTGELSLSDKLNEKGVRVRAGQEVRLVDVPADAGVGLGLFEDLHGFESAQAFADALRRAAGAYYGTPARAFLERVAGADLEAMAGDIRQAMDDFVADHCPVGADGQVRRVAGRFGLVASAGELATVLGVLPWPEDEAERAAAACFKAWLDQRGGAGAQEITAGLAQVRRFFQAHGSARFEPWENAGGVTIHNRAGYTRHDATGAREFVVFPEVVKDEVCKGYDHRLLLKELGAGGVLQRGSDGKPTHSLRPPGMDKTCRMYVFRAEVLGDES